MASKTELYSEKYSIRLFGKPEILLSGLPLELKRKKCRALVFYLAAHDTSVSRDNLQFMFWPDSDSDSARKNLNVYLYEIRKHAPTLICSDQERVWITEHTKTDVNHLRTVISSNAFDDSSINYVLSISQKNFLDGFSFHNLPDFETWQSTISEQFFSLCVRYLKTAANLCKERGDYQKGIAILNSIISIDALQESIYRELMVLYHLIGEHAKVKQLYSTLKTVLLNELDTTPMPETDSLFKRIISHQYSEPQVASDLRAPRTGKNKLSSQGGIRQRFSAPLIPFVGRESEMQLVQDMLSSDPHSLIHIDAAAGIGKTRFLRELSYFWNGIVLFANSRFESDTPYLPIIEAIHVALPEITRYIPAIFTEMDKHLRHILCYLIPEIKQTDEESVTPDNSYQLIESIRSFLALLSSYQPILFIVDDVHLLSSESLAYFMHLILSLPSCPVFFVFAQNSGRKNIDLEKFKSDLVIDGSFRSIKLDPLPYSCAEAFSSQITADNSPQLDEWIYQKSSGNAYIMTEYVRYAQMYFSQHQFSCNSLTELISDDTVPINVQRYLNHVFSMFSDNARAFLNAAALYGTHFPFDVVFTASDLSEPDALDAVDELISGNIIVSEDNETFSFHHPMLATIALMQISPSRSRFLKKRLEDAAAKHS